MSKDAVTLPHEIDDFDPRREETWESAHRELSELRDRCPVAHTSAWNGFWMLTRHADVKRALGDWRTYTTTVQNVVPAVAFTGRRPPLHLDPPEHTPYRRVLNRFFTREKVLAMEAPIRRISGELLDPLITADHADFCVDFVHPLPGRVFAVFFNLPDSTAMEIREIVRGYDGALQTGDTSMVKQASLDLYEIARQMIAERRAHPMSVEDDPTSALLAATDDAGEPLPDDMILGTLRQFIVVGMIAPIVFLGSVVVHLSEHPEVQTQLRDDPALIPAAVQEYLRLFTPYRGFARTARRDVEFGGRTIGENEPIALAYASANRDESVFPDGDRFVLNRPNIREHLAFGAGPHRCAGAPLAVELFRIVIEELLARTSAITVDGPVGMSGWPEIGTLSVPVALTASALSPLEPSR